MGQNRLSKVNSRITNSGLFDGLKELYSSSHIKARMVGEALVA